MSISSRTTRRAILLGVAISLAFLGFSVSRSALKAQEPGKTQDRKALQEQIGALHAEIEFLEIEQEVNRAVLFEAIKEERAILSKLNSFSFQKIPAVLDQTFAANLESWGADLLFMLSNTEEVDEILFKKSYSGEEKEEEKAIIDKFGQEISDELHALTKMDRKEEFSEARKRLVGRVKDKMMKNATEAVRGRIDPLKKEFGRRSAELVCKKLDLEALERRYREAR